MLRRTLLGLCLGALLLASATTAAPGPIVTGSLRTAVIDPEEVTGPALGLAYDRIRTSGATDARIYLSWFGIAPVERAALANPRDPTDPAYSWSAFDARLTQLVAKGIEPIVVLTDSPVWARRVADDPTTFGDVPALGDFMAAAAARYSGAVSGLPRVRYWQLWIEPNLSTHLSPQFGGATPVAPALYRQMTNAFADSVHAAHGDNLVVAGGLAPFRDITPAVTRIRKDWGPLSFMRDLLCLSRSLEPTCDDPVHFDVWAHHPYTSGGPTHHAVLPDDVSLGDLPEMRKVLLAGMRAGHVISNGRMRFWVTEFSWDTNPPDPKGVPVALQKRWVAEALYRMWAAGVTLVTWLQLRDEPLATSFVQSGLYFRGDTLSTDRPKPALAAFRFPLVAFPQRAGRILVWGRAPGKGASTVLVEQSFSGGWRRLAVVTTDRYGIFQRRFLAPPMGRVRARTLTSGVKAVPFSLKAVPDRFFNPFGQPLILEPKKK